MREIALDTETTGLKPEEGHRIVEIGAVELINHIPSGRTFHSYFDPRREMPADAQNVHGLTTEFLRGKPSFVDRAADFLGFLADSRLIIHNAAFDLGFLNNELRLANLAILLPQRVLDTLLLARQRHPMGPNSLDALCKRYGIDNSGREKHGALLDAGLLAQVYLELIGGRQAGLDLAANAVATPAAVAAPTSKLRARTRSLPSRLSAEERERHRAFIAGMGSHVMWLKLEEP
jgi:DNA polymerase III subunit epsilon